MPEETEKPTEALPQPPYPDWAPYCLVCSTMMRMEKKPYGWKCRSHSCGNEIKHDLTHHEGT